MSERKQKVVEVLPETDKQFLDRHGVGDQIRNLLIRVVENRPADAVTFMADYFENMGDKPTRLHKAHQQLSLTHYTRPAFTNNVTNAYSILAQRKVSHQAKGVTGVSHMELLKMMCQEFPGGVREKVLRKLHFRDTELVRFDMFKSTVFTCLVLADFLHQAGELFAVLDGTHIGKVDRVICDAVIKQLQQAINLSQDSPEGILQAGYILSIDKVHESLSKVLMRQTSSLKLTTTREEFDLMAADIFLSKVIEKVKPLQ